MTLQHSALHSVVSAAAVEEKFGWQLPAFYTDATSEYQALTQKAGVHDTSYFGRLNATGEDTLDLLNRLSTNNVLELEPGQGAATVLTSDRGRIVDLLGVVNLEEYVLLLTSPQGQQRVIDWLDKYTIMEDLVVVDITEQTVMLSVLGPQGQAVLESLTTADLPGLLPYHTLTGQVVGQDVRIVNLPLGGIPGFALITSPDDAPQVWQALVEAGATPVGLEAYEAARVAQSVPLYGPEMGEPFNPLETGLIGSIDFHKGCYIGQEVIARLDTYQKVQKRLVSLRFSPDATVVAGSNLLQEGQMMGVITSVARLPDSGELVGLGYLRAAQASVGTQLDLAEPSSGWAEVRDLPFLFGPGED